MGDELPRFDGLSAVYINCSLKRENADSHTQRLMDHSIAIMRGRGVSVESIHALDHTIRFGMSPDMSEAGYESDDWPRIAEKVMSADILVLGTPIWLGVKSSVCTLVIERLYSSSGKTNEAGQYAYYGKAGGCLVTGNEDGIKACSMEVLYALQHIGYAIPPQADAGWIGEAGPGASYGDSVEGRDVPAGFDNEFTNRNTAIMTWNLMHMAKLLKDRGGFPLGGNQPERWKKGERFGFPLDADGRRRG
ncbi:MAG: flavodoxin family protein [Phycisphaerales bacterium]